MVENFFFNPVSEARIMLPPQTSDIPGLFVKVNASAAPTSPNCIVVAICVRGKLTLCRPTDNSWTLYKSDEQLRFTDAVSHDGQLYAITESALMFITVIDLREFSKGCRSLNTKVLVMILPNWPIFSSSRRVVGDTVYLHGDPKFHLVKDHASDDLLMIMHISDHAYEDGYTNKNNLFSYTIPPRIKSLKLFKLDRSGPRWVQVDSLGDQIVFISPTNCMILSAASISKHQKKEEFRGNCIDFAFDHPCSSSPQQGRDVGVFCLADGSIKRNIPPIPRAWLTLQPVWFMPNPW